MLGGSQAVPTHPSVNPYTDKEAQLGRKTCPGFKSEAAEHGKPQCLHTPTLLSGLLYAAETQLQFN